MMSYVDQELRRQLAALAWRLPGGCIAELRATDSDWSAIVMAPNPDRVPPAQVRATTREVLAWLVGRLPARDGWPSLTPWTGAP